MMRWLASAVLAALAAGVGAAQQEGSTYTVRYEHIVSNPGSERLEDLVIHLALPGAVPWQEVLLLRTPGSASAVDDPHGNRVIACPIGTLEPGAARICSWIALVRLGAAPRGEERAAEEALRPYLADHPSLAIHHERVRSALEQAAVAEDPDRARARSIAAWVRANLTLAPEPAARPAPDVLAGGTGSARECLHVQLAMLRAGGIPARTFHGSVRRSAGDLVVDSPLSRDVECYLGEVGWIRLSELEGEPLESPLGPPGEPQLVLYRGESAQQPAAGRCSWTPVGMPGIEEHRIVYWSRGIASEEAAAIHDRMRFLGSDATRAALLQRELRQRTGPMGSRARLEWICWTLSRADGAVPEILSNFGAGVGYLPAMRGQTLDCVDLPVGHPKRLRLANVAGSGVQPGLQQAIAKGIPAVHRWWWENAGRMRYNPYTKRFTLLARRLQLR